MDQVENTELLNAIKLDDLVQFNNLIKGKMNLSFGRFPILSLCYLYNAKKIIKEHSNKLCKILEYAFVSENFEIYQTFRKVAGRALRLYIDSDSIVTPIEMLAILHKDRLVIKNFKNYSKNEHIVNNLKTIYSINGQKTYTSVSGLKIERAKLSQYQKSNYRKSLIISIIFAFVIVATYLITGLSLGIGTNAMPFKISSQKQLQMALNSGSHYVLTRNIVLDNTIKVSTFDGSINGNNYSIIINSLPDGNLINKNNGTISNLKIVYGELSGTIRNALSLFVGTNNGTIDNVDIRCDSLELACNKSSTDININSLSTTNNGTINNCRVDLTTELTSSNNGECIFSGVAGINNGTISDCIFVDGGSVTSSDIDLAGITGYNSRTGKINNCHNYAELTQSSNLEEWSPTVGGINLTNYGLISDSYNMAELNVESLLDIKNTERSILIAGISALNYGTVSKCLNTGDLNANSKNLIIYAGGITAYSEYYIEGQSMYLPLINNCISASEINLSTANDDVFIFAGGISGYLYGEILDSYSLSTFVNGYDETKYFIGSCLGASYLQYQIFNSVICISASGNYVLDDSIVYYQIGALINNGQIKPVGIDCENGEIITSMSADTIKSQEDYWYE